MKTENHQTKNNNSKSKQYFTNHCIICIFAEIHLKNARTKP